MGLSIYNQQHTVLEQFTLFYFTFVGGDMKTDHFVLRKTRLTET